MSLTITMNYVETTSFVQKTSKGREYVKNYHNTGKRMSMTRITDNGKQIGRKQSKRRFKTR